MLGPDGNIWFTEFYQGAIGRITPQGTVTEFSLGSTSHRPSGMAIGPDGNIWVVESANTTIERVSTSGQVLNTYQISGMLPFHITRGPDNAMWLVDAQNAIGRIDMNGNISVWYLPCYVPNVGDFCVPGYFQEDDDIVAGPDGALWFTAANFNIIARITTQGVLTEWPVPPTGLGLAAPSHLTVLGRKIYFVGGGNFLGTISL
jgi:virginiamycin B lyase